MRKRAQLLTITILSLVFIPIVPVLAVNDDIPVSNTSNTEQPVVGLEKPIVQEDTTAAEYKAKLQERLTKRKAAVKTKLTKVQETRLKNRCKAAQGLIQSISSNTKQVSTSRSEVYSKIIARMSSLSESLKKQGIDTSELDGMITELKTLIATFETNMADLRQSAIDLSSMDCAADPSGFKASLEALRTSRVAVVKSSTDIRAHIKDIIKPELETIKAGLDGSSTSRQKEEVN